jgi:myo-inositol-1(or 4)-monophosphatase
MAMNLKSARKTAVAAALAVGKVMHANWHKPKHVNCAEAHDIKLELDVRCQAIIEKILAQAYPQMPVLGEEGITGDGTAEYRWVVDPIDGTVNYAFGIPHAATSIALQYREQSVVGVIYDPFADELWTTIRGEPTRLNGKIVKVSDRAKVEEAIIAMGFSKSQDNLEKCLPHQARLTRRAKKIRVMGSAAIELAYVASGRLDAYIELRVNLWDIAAGGLILERAGGEFWRQPIPRKKHVFRLIANNGRVRREIQKLGVFRESK